MSADASSVSVPNLGITKSSDNPAVGFIGGLLIEIFIACMYVQSLCYPLFDSRSSTVPSLYGITTLQSFMYFQKYPNDALSLKLLVSLHFLQSSPPSLPLPQVGAVWSVSSVRPNLCSR